MTYLTTYADLSEEQLDKICILDKREIDSLIEKYDIYTNSIELEIDDDIDGYDLTNYILYRILVEIILDNVEDQDDINTLENSIYTNCLDYGFDVDPDKLKTDTAKKLLKDF
jgi:hypothetical protein